MSGAVLPGGAPMGPGARAGQPRVVRVRLDEIMAALDGPDAALRAWCAALLERPSRAQGIDADELRRLWDGGLATARIAAVMRCGLSKVKAAAKALRLTPRGRGWKPAGARPGRAFILDPGRVAALAAEGLNSSAMARRLCVDDGTVRAALRRWGIAAPGVKQRLTLIDPARLRALWGTATLAQMAAEFRCRQSSVNRAARRLGLPVRPGGRPPAVAADAALLRRWWAEERSAAWMAAQIGGPTTAKAVQQRLQRLGLKRPLGWKPPGWEPVLRVAAPPMPPVAVATSRPQPQPAAPRDPPRSAEQAAIAAYIARRGVTRCPTTAVLPTQGAIPPRGAHELRRRAEAMAAKDLAVKRARGRRAARTRGLDPRPQGAAP